MIIEYLYFLNIYFSGRIQTLNPYSRDDVSSATFSKVCIHYIIKFGKTNLKLLKILLPQVSTYYAHFVLLLGA